MTIATTAIWDTALAYVEKTLSVRLNRPTMVRRPHGRSIGIQTDRGTWIRIENRPAAQPLMHNWVGIEDASKLPGVAKPELFQSIRWQHSVNGLRWRADEMQLVTSPVVDGNGIVLAEPDLPAIWWRTLAASIAALAAHHTDRVAVTQEHLTHRIHQVFGEQIDTTVTEWATEHADMTWDNITAPECYILDWEDWGLAPRGRTVASLWAHSLAVPNLAAKIAREFDELFSLRSAKISQLLICANIVRNASRRAGAKPLLAPAQRAAAHLITELR